MAEGQKTFLVRSRAAARSRTVIPRSRQFEEAERREEGDGLAQSSRIDRPEPEDLR